MESKIHLLALLFKTPETVLEVEIQPTSEIPSEVTSIDSTETHLQLALQSRPEPQYAKLLFENRKLETVLIRNGLLPRLDFYAALGRSGFGDESQQSIKNIDGPSYDFSAGLSSNYNLGARHRCTRSKGTSAKRLTCESNQ